MSKLKEQVSVMKQLQKIAKIFKASKGKIRPHFILTGSSGSGKSFAVEALSDMEDLGFLEVNAAQLTKEGTAGNSLSKALSGINTKAGRPTIVFVDEFDKLFISGNNNSELAHETTNGVQNEFLKVLESKSTAVYGDYGKYVDVDISNVLFVFAGAFNGAQELNIDKLRDFGIKVEFLGRVGLVFNMPKLSLDSMREALETSPVLEDYLKVFKDTNKQKVVSDLMPHVEANYEKNTLGIRMIVTLLHQYFINDGKIPQKEVDNSTFQTLTMEA